MSMWANSKPKHQPRGTLVGRTPTDPDETMPMDDGYVAKPMVIDSEFIHNSAESFDNGEITTFFRNIPFHNTDDLDSYCDYFGLDTKLIVQDHGMRNYVNDRWEYVMHNKELNTNYELIPAFNDNPTRSITEYDLVTLPEFCAEDMACIPAFIAAKSKLRDDYVKLHKSHPLDSQLFDDFIRMYHTVPKFTRAELRRLKRKKRSNTHIKWHVETIVKIAAADFLLGHVLRIAAGMVLG